MQSNEKKFVLNLHNSAVYQADKLILDGVNLIVKEGEFCYLVGKTGSGKTSLLKTIYAALPFRRGVGRVVGFDLTKIKRNKIPMLRRKLGIVFQEFNLLMDQTVEENLDFVLKATGTSTKLKRKSRISEVLDLVDLPEKRKAMPFALSGGEQQRIMIARALLNNPALLLADEPTGNLDPESSDRILKLLVSLAQEGHTAVLMATHDYRVIEQFPARVIRCRNGKIFDDPDFGQEGLRTATIP